MSAMVLCRQRLWFVMVLAAAAVGCGGSDRPATIPISGRITVDGQPPGESGKMHFAPTQAAEGYSIRPATGTFLADGSYRVMSWAPDDGLVPGHYKVSFMPGNPNKTVIPPRYRQAGTSGLELDVPADQSTIEYNVELKSD